MPDPQTPDDDGRGHDDGDVFAGERSEREAALDLQLEAFFSDLMTTEGFDLDALTASSRRVMRLIRSKLSGKGKP